MQRLAARIDAMAEQVESDRFHYLSLHEKFHRRIAECTRCESLCDAIEKTHALASTWMCVCRPSTPDCLRSKHQDLVEALSSGDPERAAEAMRRHILSSKSRATERLQPYFHLNQTRGVTYSRSPKKQLQTKISLEKAEAVTAS